MKHLKRSITALSMALFCLSGNAQVEPFSCGHSKMQEELWEKNPQMKQDFEILKNKCLQTTSTNGIQKSTYIIPIVFHIIHEYGSENITDAQVYDQVAILNRDYRKLNADTSEIVNEFKQIVTDCNIEFRLPSVDPYGNCSNGIEHIYSHETFNGDDYSKLNQWHRDQYLNVWVVASMRNGVAGYAYFPSSISNVGFFADGIIILNNYIGSTGTANLLRSRALTHEIGHYLGLPHVWGGTNEPGVACGDDGIEDTPLTKGYNFCPQTTAQGSICDPTIVENYQNYMDYSYCSNMFTHDQGSYMRNILEQVERATLWSPENLDTTGALLNPKPLCKPVADFNWDMKLVCEGETVNFSDASWNGVVESRTWYFQDGTPSTSTIANPSVKFSGFGYKTVQLIVSNASGTDTLTVQKGVFNSSYTEKYGPFSDNFDESNEYNFWIVNNVEENFGKFEMTENVGINNSRAWKLGLYRAIDPQNPFTENFYYANRLGGSVDALILPSTDLSNTSNATLNFDYAYATNTQDLANMTETMKVYVSKNCGKTWILRKNIQESELITGGFSGGMAFVPNSTNLWKNISIPLNTVATDKNVRVKIEFTASDYSNNLYIDNVNISGVLSVAENPIQEMNVQVYPNPSELNSDIYISFTGNGTEINVELVDLQGKIIQTNAFTENGQANVKLASSQNLQAGCYFVKVSQGKYAQTKKLIIQ